MMARSRGRFGTTIRRVSVMCAAGLLGTVFGVVGDPAASAHISQFSGHGNCGSQSGTSPYTYLLIGTSGNDYCEAHSVRDDMVGGNGGDTLKGLEQGDLIKGDTGPDSLYGGPGNDLVRGGPGGTDPFAGGTLDVGRGGDGNDEVTDTAGPRFGDPSDYDYVCDGPGRDTLETVDNDPNDTIVCLCDDAQDEVIIDFSDVNGYFPNTQCGI